MIFTCGKCQKNFEIMDDCLKHEIVCTGKKVRIYIKLGEGEKLYIASNITDTDDFILTTNPNMAGIFEYGMRKIAKDTLIRLLKRRFGFDIENIYIKSECGYDDNDDIKYNFEHDYHAEICYEGV